MYVSTLHIPWLGKSTSEEVRILSQSNEGIPIKQSPNPPYITLSKPCHMLDKPYRG